MDSSVGIGTQLNCGYGQTGTSCPGGNKELDRGSCSGQTLFGADDNYNCRVGAPMGSNCPFVVAAGEGPRSGDVWCRVTRIHNDAAHLCADDPTEVCTPSTAELDERTSNAAAARWLSLGVHSSKS